MGRGYKEGHEVGGMGELGEPLVIQPLWEAEF